MGARSNTEILSDIADARPDAIALWDHGSETTYADLSSNAGKAANALSDAGLTLGDVVLVGWETMTRHITLLLALERLAATAASYASPVEESGYDAIFGEAAFVLSPIGDDGGTGIATICIDDDWWTKTLAAGSASAPLREFGPDDGFRIVRTSGTTGQASLMRANRAQAYARIEALPREYGYTTGSHFMTAMPFSFQAVDHNAFACLREGGTVYFENRVSFADALVQTGATHSALLPMEAHTLDRPESLSLVDTPVTILVYGGGVSEPMLDRLKKKHPAANFITTYATNEVGTVARRVGEGLYEVIPDADVEVTDDADKPLPVGTEGNIRVRRIGMYGSYIGDPERSALRFRGGWFYPGDIGVMTEDGLLRVIGRGDDILNVRGLKVPASAIEEQLHAVAGLADAALVELPATGRLCVIIQLEPGISLASVMPEVQTILPREAGEIDLLTSEVIPRTESGKIKRNALRDALTKALR